MAVNSFLQLFEFTDLPVVKWVNGYYDPHRMDAAFIYDIPSNTLYLSHTHHASIERATGLRTFNYPSHDPDGTKGPHDLSSIKNHNVMSGRAYPEPNNVTFVEVFTFLAVPPPLEAALKQIFRVPEIFTFASHQHEGLPIAMEDDSLCEWELRDHTPIPRSTEFFREWIITATDGKRYRCSGTSRDVAQRKADAKGITVAAIDQAPAH